MQAKLVNSCQEGSQAKSRSCRAGDWLEPRAGEGKPASRRLLMALGSGEGVAPSGPGMGEASARENGGAG